MMANWWVKIKYVLPTKALLLLVILVLVTLPVLCWNLQYSAFFISGDINYAGYLKRTENNRRIAEARTYFSQKKRNETLHYRSPQLLLISDKVRYPSVAFMIIAADRNRQDIHYYQPSYLMQTAHRLWNSVEKDVKEFGHRFSNLTLSLCDIDNFPAKFYEMHYTSRFFEHLPMTENRISKNNKCKVKLHFLSCLSMLVAKHANVDYVVVLEDDLLAKNDAVSGLAQVFDSLTKRFHDKIKDRLGFVELYHPLHQLRYSAIDPASWLEIMVVSVPLLFLLLVCYFRLHLRPLFPLHNIVLLITLMCVCVCVVLVVGRAHWLLFYQAFTHTYYLTDTSSTVSSAAVLLARDFVFELLSHGIDYGCYRVESNYELMQTAARVSRRRIVAVNSNLFKHVGLYSSFSKTVVNAHIVE